MMPDIYFSSDNHYNHAKALTFISSIDDVTLMRPGFTSVEEMDEHMIEKHNSVVKPEDKWYCMGDLFIGKGATSRIRFHDIMKRLNGKKRLILGNHDDLPFAHYTAYFEKIMESRRMDKMLFTHRPALIGKNDKKVSASVHGHIHEQVIDDDRYLNLSVEQINYTPVSFEQIVQTLKDRGIKTS